MKINYLNRYITWLFKKSDFAFIIIQNVLKNISRYLTFWIIQDLHVVYS